jgi:arsenite/tail-anchored protein-transporting ATPase
MIQNNNHPAHKSISVFAGKGGVGKTTCAAATAFHHASLGKRTLCISTDPTPSLSHIFEKANQYQPVKIIDSLYIHEIGQTEIKDMWDKKFGKEVYEVFSSFISITYDNFTEFMTSVLPGLGDEFIVDYIRELFLHSEYDAVVWDTAPLGQTLALLQTPALLVKHLRLAPRIYSKLRLSDNNKEPILNILQRWQNLSSLNMDFLTNDVIFAIVTIPEALAVNQLEYIFHEMDGYNLQVKQLIVNNKVKADSSEFLSTKANQQKYYLNQIHQQYSNLKITELPMLPHEIKGLNYISEISNMLFRD